MSNDSLAQTIKQKIQSSLTPEHFQLNDISGGCGSSFEMIVVSSVFEGKSLLARHRLVNSSLADEISHLHALTLKTLSPSEWQSSFHHKEHQKQACDK